MAPLTIWCLKDPGVLTPSQTAFCESLLTGSEKEHAGLITHADRKREYLLGHTLARKGLAFALDCEPVQVPLIFAPRQQPYEAPRLDQSHPLAQNWHVSLSHTDGLLAVAVAQASVGVDVEKRGPKRNYRLNLLAGDFPEKELILSLPVEEGWKLYSDLFSLKEAFHKATQYGFLASQKDISFSIDSQQKVSFECLKKSTPLSVLSCQLFYPTQDHVLALALNQGRPVETHLIWMNMDDLFLRATFKPSFR